MTSGAIVDDVQEMGCTCVIFDLYKTLVKNSTNMGSPKTSDVLPGRAECLRALKKAGIATGIATNHGNAVAKGKLTIQELQHGLLSIQKMLAIGCVETCVHKEGSANPVLDKDCACHKPHPGMLFRIMEQDGVSPEQTLYVGDKPKDKHAAENAGCHFMWATEFFRERPSPQEENS